MGTNVLAALSCCNGDLILSVWRKDDGLLLDEQPITYDASELLVHSDKILIGDHMDRDQVPVAIYEYREGQVLGPRLMTVAKNLSGLATEPHWAGMCFDKADPGILVTAYDAPDSSWLCVDKWDLEEEKHIKTFMVGKGGCGRVNNLSIVLLNNQKLLTVTPIIGERRLVIIDMNTGVIGKTIRVEEHRAIHQSINPFFPSNGNFVMLRDGFLRGQNDILEKEQDRMWRGRLIGNDNDEFFMMNETKLIGRLVSNERILVVLDFWEVEDPEDGTDDVDDGVSGEEKDTEDKEEENGIEEEDTTEAERSFRKDGGFNEEVA